MQIFKSFLDFFFNYYYLKKKTTNSENSVVSIVIFGKHISPSSGIEVLHNEKRKKISVVFVFRIQFKELLRFLFCKTCVILLALHDAL